MSTVLGKVPTWSYLIVQVNCLPSTLYQCCGFAFQNVNTDPPSEKINADPDRSDPWNLDPKGRKTKKIGLF